MEYKWKRFSQLWSNLKGPSQPVCIARVYHCYYPASFTYHPVKDVSCQSDSCCLLLSHVRSNFMLNGFRNRNQHGLCSRLKTEYELLRIPITSRMQDELAGVQENLGDSIAQPIPDWIVIIVDTFYLLGSGSTWLYEFWVEFPCKS